MEIINNVAKNITEIAGGVCAPKGFRAGGVHCGIRKNKTKKDLALIVSDVVGTSASVYTKNLVKGAPIVVTQKNLRDGKAQAIVCNSGNANTCNANGEEIAYEMCALVAKHMGIKADDVIVASTGVIGQTLDITPIAEGMPSLIKSLKAGEVGSDDASAAIMTTDLVKKEIAFSFTVGGKECKIGGIAKGSGMINPNMATMLVFITTDVKISAEMLTKALRADADATFNMITVDGDTSTNDMVSVIANGMAGNAEIKSVGADYDAFCTALFAVTSTLSKKIAKDGEGATKLLECNVCGAKSVKDARIASKGVVSSSLFKAAMFGEDANWGRVLCAIGYSGADTDVTKIDVSFRSANGTVAVCKMGAGIPFSEDEAKKVLSASDISIDITMRDGSAKATAWGCDLTFDYVKINGSYRS